MSAGIAARPIGEVAGWRMPLAVLGAGAALLLLLFHAEAAAALHVWRGSTAYGHCFLVVPIAAWLAWERRGALARLGPSPWPAAALAALPLAAAWFAAERLGVMEGRQLVAVALLLVLALSVLGRRLWWAFSVPLLYLFLLVPFGGLLVPPLQAFTARFIDLGLDLLGIAHVVTRFVIEIPEGTFRVAEACAGLRFVIAAIAFGIVYACTFYRSPGRRLGFVAACLVVPVIANGIRALAIVVVGHLSGSARAAAVDHLVYGWIFFSAVILLLILGGLPFRQDIPPASPAGRPAVAVLPGTRRRLLLGACAVLLLAATAPAVSHLLDQRADAEQALLPAGLPMPPAARSGCRVVAPGRFDCGGVPIAVTMRTFPVHASPATLIAALRDATGEFAAADSSVSTWTLPHGQPRRWQVTQTAGPDRLVATCLWIGGVAQAPGLGMRLRQARASVLGSDTAPVLVVVSAASGATPDERKAAGATLRLFLDDQSWDDQSWDDQSWVPLHGAPLS